MKVLKFGGTSVGSAQRIKALLDIINPNERQIVVLSAVAGTTNALVDIAQAFTEGDKEKAAGLIRTLRGKYDTLISELFATPEGHQNGKELLDYHFDLITSFSSDLFTPIEEKIILAQGELI